MITRSSLCGLRAPPRYSRIHLHNTRIYNIHSFQNPSLTPTIHQSTTQRSNSTSATGINHNKKINGPITTLPAPLVLPVRGPDQSTTSYYFHFGRAYLAFYKTGLKNIWHNYVASRNILRTLIEPKIGGRLISTKPGGTLHRAVRSGLLTRSDFQLLIRTWHDLKRIPSFALVFIVCGEFTPLVVPFLGRVVPRTCQIPKQVRTVREKMEGRRKASFRELVVAPPTEDVGVEGLKREQLLHISRSLGLHSSWWPEGFGLPPDGLLKARIRERAEYLDIDDHLIESDGGVGEMEMEELRMALEERGVDVLGKNDEQLKMLLRTWLWARVRRPVMTLFLTRPSVWETLEL
ncbi:MAG: hypothetical protein M1830_010823 [Pleopsidium flavum]|nr:MAG: hypothetical protein M1830_010823 [Pleopsidium flavum]